MAATVELYAVTAYTGTPPAASATVRIFDVTVISAQPANAPEAFAGSAVANVEPWTVVSLNGAGVAAPGFSIVGWAWTQVAGTTAPTTGADTAAPSVEIQGTRAGETVTFSLIVTDNQGAVSNASTVDITSLPATELVVRGGVLTPYKPMRV